MNGLGLAGVSWWALSKAEREDLAAENDIDAAEDRRDYGDDDE